MNLSLQKLNQFVQGHRVESVAGLLGLLVAGVVVMLDCEHSNQTVERLYSETVDGLNQVGDLQYQVQETRRLALYGLTSTDSNVQLQSADATRAVEKLASERISAHRQILEAMGELAIWTRLQTDWNSYLQIRDEVLSAVLEGDRQGAIALDLRAGAPRYDQVREDIKVIKQCHLDRAKARLAEVKSLSRRSMFKIVTIFTLYLLGGTLAVHVLRRGTLAMRESEARFRGVVESLGEGILITDPDDKIQFLNARINELLGWSGDELLGRKASEVMMSPEHAATMRERSALRFQGISERYEMALRRKDDREIWVAVHSTPFRDAGGRITGALGAFTDITEQRRAARDLAQLNEQFAKTQRQAGMAEVATSVLHNVGNVLNSVNVSVSLLRDKVSKSEIRHLVKTTNLLRARASDAAAFLTSDPQGKLLPAFLVKLGDQLAVEQLALQEELNDLTKNIEHIKEIVAMQQSYASLSGVTEALQAAELIEDALRMNDAALGRHGVTVVRAFEQVSSVAMDRHKVLQILVNLIRNAKYSMDQSNKTDRTLTLSVLKGDHDQVRIQVRDTGMGIPRENLTRIFQHGFTTKKEGHGFGLHSGANAAKEMGGSLSVQSDGPGQGAVFTLELPAATPKTTPPISRELQLACHSDN